MRAVIRRVPLWLRIVAFVAAWGLVLSGVTPVGARSGKSCTLDGQNFMAFGTYDPMRNGALEMQGRVSYRCGNKSGGPDVAAQGSLTVQISLSAGSAGQFDRYMTGPPGEQLRYNLYLDSSRTTVWGDGTGGTRVYTDKAQPNNHVVTVPVFGRIYGAQDVGAGNYADSVIVTLDF